MGGTYIHHGVSSVQIAGLSPLHAEQALSWEQFDRIRSSGGLFRQRIVVHCIVVKDWMLKAVRIVAVRCDMRRASLRDLGGLGMLCTLAAELVSAISVCSIK